MSPAAWLLLIQLLKVSSTDFKQVERNVKVSVRLVVKGSRIVTHKIVQEIKRAR